MFLGLLIVALIGFDLIDRFFLIIVLVVGLAISLLGRKYKIPVIYWFLKHFGRKEEINRFPGKGAFFLIFGSALSLYLFEENVALASIMILALADSIAPLVGRYGSIRNPMNAKKYIEGFVFGVAAGTLGAWLFVDFTRAFIASIVAMLVEGFDLKVGLSLLDDNLIIPLVAGFVMSLMVLFI